jgi:hypothetical protein
MIDIKVEKWDTFWPDAQRIFPQHWKELALYQNEIPLDIDTAKYEALDKAGILLILTARTTCEVMIGYFLWFLMPHPHYKSTPMGMTDMYFVLPGYRGGVGAKLFIEGERELKRRGVVKAITSCKVHEDHSKLLGRLGWQLTDLTFGKLL